MLFRNQALCLACAAATATAFVPSNTIGMKLSPRDLISPRVRVRGVISPTLRYLNTLSDNRNNKISSLKSTLTSDEEASKTAQDDANQDPPNAEDIPEFPSKNEHGIYDILNADQHNAWLKANPDKLMVIKFFAPWCRACKSVEPKYIQISKDEKYSDIPIIFGQLSVQHNKAYVKSLGIMALPSIQIYAGSEGLVENFPCGPSKIPMLKRKLTDTINAKVDPQNRTLKLDCANPANKEAEPCRTRSLTVLDETDSSNEIDEVISDQRKEENLRYLRTGVPYFKDFDDDEFYDLMDKAKLVTFEQGDVIMRQGMEGTMFYVIESGEVEITVRTAFEDPLTTPSDYLGAVINILGPHNYFGERALITHEPRAASVRATQKTRCFAFDVNDIPSSSVLSGKKEASLERMQEINNKYGTDVYDIDLIESQFKSANTANQQRGSVNNPKQIIGVDTDDIIPDQTATMEIDEVSGSQANDRVISLLVRFKQIRRAARCFEYIMKTKPKFGDVGEARRRALLVSKLTKYQRSEFTELFKLIDQSGDGFISLLELRRAMESVGQERSDDELLQMINNANPEIDGNTEINFSEFMGMMAEAEFYYLFIETFEALDSNKSGFVSAGDLNRVLCGVRDLVSDDRMSIIDTSDMDMQVDYETFADMLLGKPL